jgi:uncharacterized protein YybS (DUF2232 family)
MLPIVVVTLAVWGGAAAASIYAVTFGVLTLVLAASIRRAESIDTAVALSTAAVLVGVCAVTWSAAGGPEHVLEHLRAGLDAGRARLIEMGREGGASAEILRRFEEHGPRVVETMVRLAPALLIDAVGAIVLVNLLLVRSLQRVAGEEPAFGDLTRWRCPAALIWVLIAAGYAVFLSAPVVRWTAINGLAVVLGIYFCQGMAIIRFYFQRWQVAFWARALTYCFVALEWLVAGGVVLLGIFDLWGDFRRLTPRPAEEE